MNTNKAMSNLTMGKIAFGPYTEATHQMVPINSGISLRDHFAGLAMQSLIEQHGDVSKITDCDGFVSLHLRAYEHADSMLKARAQ